MSNPIRVMVVDDHAMVRSGLRLFLEGYDDLEFAGEAENGEQAAAIAAACRPDVILMDMVLPGIDGAEATRRVLQTRPEARVLALTSFHEKDLVEGAFRAGATGYLLKNVSADELAQAIREAHRGKPTLAAEAASALIESTRNEPGLGADLTERERETLGLMVEGLSNGQIARRLSISESTVKFHVSSVLGKLGVDNRVQAVRLATEHGLTSKHAPNS
ncbi:MAG TPA: response regulator transcription factor [Anaerolineales bacterium]|nr:response regulator transcription factor [Anaerolineales bacterium]